MPENSPAMIRSERLRAIFDGLNTFGRSPDSGGYSRIGFSDADMAARRWFADRMKAEGLAVAWDGAANVFGRLGSSDRPSVMIGSHLDTVPDGGAFDGALGVAVALECALALRDAGRRLTHPIEVVATSEEEGRFGGMLGSQAMTGAIAREWLEAASDADGIRLRDAMAAQGLDFETAMTAARTPGSVKAFFELHVEQGPVLEAAGVSIGIVDRISGVVNWAVTLNGLANHSGTTPMDMRADAFAGLAQIAAGIPELISQCGTPDSRITIGRVQLQPNFPHTIPGQADFSVIIRDGEEAAIHRLCEALRNAIDVASADHGLHWKIEEKSRLQPVLLDHAIASLLAHTARELCLRSLPMASGAGHDAQTMQALCPSGLVFVPSRRGVSHAPDEWTDWPSILDGARLMLAAVERTAA